MRKPLTLFCILIFFCGICYAQTAKQPPKDTQDKRIDSLFQKLSDVKYDSLKSRAEFTLTRANDNIELAKSIFQVMAWIGGIGGLLLTLLGIIGVREVLNIRRFRTQAETRIKNLEKRAEFLLAQTEEKMRQIEEFKLQAASKTEEVKLDFLKEAEAIPSKDRTGAIEKYEELNEKVFGTKVFLSMAENYFEAHLFEEAHVEIKKYAKKSVLDAYAYYVWAVILFGLSKHNEAEKKLEQSSVLFPNEYSTYLGWAIILITREKYNLAIEKLNKSLELKETALALYHRAQAYAGLQDTRNALKDLTRAFSIDPSLKSRATEDYMFKPLLENPDFKKVVA